MSALSLSVWCWNLAQLYPVSPSQDQLFGTVNTLAQIAGGLFATIVTVVVFAIGLAAQKLDRGSAYVPFMARRHHVFLIAAFSASLGITNAVLPGFVDLVGPSTIAYLLWANAIAMPAVVLAALLMMCGVIESVSQSDMKTSLPVLRSTLREVVDHDKRQAALARAFVELLKSGPIKLDMNAGYILGPLPQRFTGAGVQAPIVDVDLRVLEQLNKMCQPLVELAHFAITRHPGLYCDLRGVLHVSLTRSTREASPSPTGNHAMDTSSDPARSSNSVGAVIGDARLARLDSLSSQLFIYATNAESARSREFFEQIQQQLEHLARSGQSLALSSRLKEYRQMLSAWISIKGPATNAPQRQLFEALSSESFGPLDVDLHRVTRQSVESKDFDTYQVVVEQLAGMFWDADDLCASAVCGNAAKLLASAFNHGIRSDGFETKTEVLVDGLINSLLMMRPSLNEPGRVLPNTLPKEQDDHARAMRYAMLTALLAMIRYATEAGRATAATKLLDRLTRQTSTDEVRRHIPMQAHGRDDGAALINYSLIVVIGWCGHMIKVKHPRVDTARAVLAHVLKFIPPRHVLVSVWELYRSGTSVSAQVDSELNIEHWSLRGIMRSGFVYNGTDSSSWVPGGFWIAMLKEEPAETYKPDHFFDRVPPRMLWKPEGLDGKLSDSQKLAWPDDADETAKGQARSEVIALIQARERLADAPAIRRIALDPLPVNLDAHLQQGMVKRVKTLRDRHSALFGPLHKLQSATVCPISAERWCKIFRDDFVSQSDRASGYPGLLASGMVESEREHLARLVEQEVELDPTPLSLSTLRERILSAKRKLVNLGFKPDLLILPQNERFKLAVCGQELWVRRLGEHSGHGEVKIPEWEGLKVVLFPYVDASSAIVADSSELFGRVDDDASLPIVKITDMSETDRLAIAPRATDVGSEPLPESTKIMVRADASLTPVIGIANVAAAYRLDLLNGDGSYVMKPNDTLYHRPTCELVQSVDELVRSLHPWIKGESTGRGPCPACRPNEWDREVVARTYTSK